MTDLYRSRLYPLLARLEAERAHHLALRALRASGYVPGAEQLLRHFSGSPDPRLAVEAFGLTFPNPLGMAAGFDKNAEAVESLFALGFGAVEVGTVTPLPQPGNAAPRLWRFPEQGALVNALGFPSDGAAAVRGNLVGRRYPGVLGINLGKNRATPADEAAQDYVAVLGVLWDVADYVTVNVSSPNTPGLRDLQRRDALTALVRAVVEQDARLAKLHDGTSRPVLVKLAPDLDAGQLEEATQSALEGGAAGIIVANTTTSRDGLPPHSRDLPGGTSGRPLKERATDLVRQVRRLAPTLPIVGVGGISCAADVVERMRAGATLVQLYTGFIYGGPALPAEILHGLGDYLDREGLRSISEIVGTE